MRGGRKRGKEGWRQDERTKENEERQKRAEKLLIRKKFIFMAQLLLQRENRGVDEGQGLNK